MAQKGSDRAEKAGGKVWDISPRKRVLRSPVVAKKVDIVKPKSKKKKIIISETIEDNDNEGEVEVNDNGEDRHKGKA